MHELNKSSNKDKPCVSACVFACIQSAAGLLAEREKIQKEIQNLEEVLGPHSPIIVSGTSLWLFCSVSVEPGNSDLGLSPSVDSCLQMNLVYQQVVQETLDQLEKLLTQNQKDIRARQLQVSKNTQPETMYLGRFLKPYFKDKLTGLVRQTYPTTDTGLLLLQLTNKGLCLSVCLQGPPANQEAKEKTSRIAGYLDDKKLKIKRCKTVQTPPPLFFLPKVKQTK
uniref:Uncharacterized protein n=1 Tax=Oreochromis aureus TaxID=47969 RepID=A0AAZ1WVR4_OREAU